MILDYLRINDLVDSKVEYYGYTRSWSKIGTAISALIAGAVVFYCGEYRHLFIISVFSYSG